MSIETRWFGFTVYKFSRITGGPHVWNVMFRLGRKIPLGVTSVTHVGEFDKGGIIK